MGRIHSLNVGLPRVIGHRRGEPVLSGIVKEPVQERRLASGVNIDGDGQADLTVHGGVDKAIYAYAVEDIAWWSEQLGRELPAGVFGENLTTEGIDCTGAVVGERWHVGEAVFEVCQPRLPCFKLGMVFDDPKMLKHFVQASRPGVYLRIAEEGEIGPGDTVEVVDRPAHGVTVSLVADAIQKDLALAPKALEAPQLAAGLAGWLAQRV
jgi:MOSC domain-containing protein YiiM